MPDRIKGSLWLRTPVSWILAAAVLLASAGAAAAGGSPAPPVVGLTGRAYDGLNYNVRPAIAWQSLPLAQLPAIDAINKAKSDQSGGDEESQLKELESLEKLIEVEQKTLDAAQAEAHLAHQQFTQLTDDLESKVAGNPDGVAEFSEKVQQAEANFSAAHNQVQALQKKLSAMRDRFEELQLERIAALGSSDGSAEPAGGDGESALQNFFTLKNLLDWVEEHGLKLLAILLGTFLLYLLVKSSQKHLVKALATAGSRGSIIERENRAVTLVSVFRNVATITVLAGGGMMLLQEVGISIAPLLGGAAVFGLAIAFGAQNLVKDYFSGFMLLLEDQYGINDVVKIGDIAGAVEAITLRVTSLRDLEGTMHFIPHGTITTVSNMTHGWSRALLDIGVAYKEDTDRVSDELLEIAKGMRSDEKFGEFIIGDAELLGVDALGDSAVVIKMCIKTQPLKKWAVKREMLRRIKHRFDEVGIEIPFPHRTVFVHREDDEPKESSGDKEAA